MAENASGGYTRGSASGDDIQQDEEGEDQVCLFCGGMPCNWIDLGPDLLEQLEGMYSLNDKGKKVDANGDIIPNNQLCKSLYRLYVTAQFGYLGNGERVQVPECVSKKIKAVYPDYNGKYMGCKEN